MAAPPGHSSPIVPVLMRWMSRANVWIYERTDGRIGGTWRIGAAFPRGVAVALLTTTGRKTGLRRTTPLLYLRDGDDVVMVASQGGLPRHPGWYWNITANPVVSVQIGAVVSEMSARIANADERRALWPRLVDLYADFDTYQSWTDREIPVVIFTPLQP